jgi:hypothetical protein
LTHPEGDLTIFDLVFIAAFFATLILIIRILWKLFRRDFRMVHRSAIQLGVFGALYMAALLAASLLIPQRILKKHEARCFDDWCLAVENCTLTSDADQDHYVMGLRVSSRAGRVSESELEIDERDFFIDHGKDFKAEKKRNDHANESPAMNHDFMLEYFPFLFKHGKDV